MLTATSDAAETIRIIRHAASPATVTTAKIPKNNSKRKKKKMAF
jgi:hypothetical protein